MVSILPFRGTRPFTEDAKSLIAPSTDHLSIENIDIFRKNNYWNYLKVLNPIGQLKEIDTLSEAKNHFTEMKKNEVIKKDTQNNYYVYQIEFKGHVQTGFLSLAKISDFLNENIKAHEKIYENRMRERAEQMLNIKTQIGPIYVFYKENNNIKNLLNSILNKIPEYDFESFDKSIHKLWCISDKNFIFELTTFFYKEVKSFYIADGHHRMGAMKIIGDLKYNKNIYQENFMIAAFPSDEAKIFDYNRVVKDLNGLSEEKFLRVISENFIIKKQNKSFKPTKSKEFGMYHEGNWYSLYFNSDLKSDNFIENLDINILNSYIFKKYLNIEDVNNDERIRFIPGCHGLEALEKKVDENTDSVAFSIFPTLISDVIRIADNKLSMPPKSTWFDPKPLDGLVVYEFEKNNNE